MQEIILSRYQTQRIVPLGHGYTVSREDGILRAVPMDSAGNLDYDGEYNVSTAAFGSYEERDHFIKTIHQHTGWKEWEHYRFEEVPTKRKQFMADEFYCHLSNFLSAGEALSAYWEEYGDGDNDPRFFLPFAGYPFMGASFDDVVAGIRKWKETVYNRIVKAKEARDGSHL